MDGYYSEELVRERVEARGVGDVAPGIDREQVIDSITATIVRATRQ